MQLLHVDSSILGSNSASRQLTAEVVDAERRRVPGLKVVDHQEHYLQNLFRFLGITDITIVRAEGLAMGDNRAASIAAAQNAIAALA